MKKAEVIFLVLCIIISGRSAGQDTLPNGKAVNLPFRKYGLSIGNSYEFTGIRLNYSDKMVRKINGLNITAWSRFRPDYNKNEVVNGISLGGLGTAKSMQPLNIFVVGAMSFEHLNGISFGGIGIGSGNINGICGSAVFLEGGYANGVIFSGLLAYAENAFNGFSAAGLAVLTKGNINGAAVSIAGLYSEGSINGLAMTAGYLKSTKIQGITLAGYSNVDQVKGLSIALVNNTRELHGMQLGIINIARNNRQGLKCLPLVNLHF